MTAYLLIELVLKTTGLLCARLRLPWPCTCTVALAASVRHAFQLLRVCPRWGHGPSSSHRWRGLGLHLGLRLVGISVCTSAFKGTDVAHCQVTVSCTIEHLPVQVYKSARLLWRKAVSQCNASEDTRADRLYTRGEGEGEREREREREDIQHYKSSEKRTLKLGLPRPMRARPMLHLVQHELTAHSKYSTLEAAMCLRCCVTPLGRRTAIRPSLAYIARSQQCLPAHTEVSRACAGTAPAFVAGEDATARI